MSNEGNVAQSLSDKKYQYFGSNRYYVTGTGVGSATAFTFIDFSGTNTGFGPANGLLSQRIILTTSGTSTYQYSFVGSPAQYTDPVTGRVLPSSTKVFDGSNHSGVWIRTDVASRVLFVEAW